MTELPQRSDFGDYGRWPGRDVLDSGGERLGSVREIYLDDATDRPEWVLVDLDDGSARFVPLADAAVESEAIRVVHAADRVSAAPAYEPSKELTQDQERELYGHYEVPASEEASDTVLPELDETPAAPTEPELEAAAPPAPEPAPEAAAPPEPEPEPAPETPEPEPEPVEELAGTPEPPPPVPPTPEPEPEPVAELPAPGETSEPEDSGPPVPPRPEPIAPTPPPPPQPSPPPPYPAADTSSGGGLPVPMPVAAGLAAVLAILAIILIRRRS